MGIRSPRFQDCSALGIERTLLKAWSLVIPIPLVPIRWNTLWQQRFCRVLVTGTLTEKYTGVRVVFQLFKSSFTAVSKRLKQELWAGISFLPLVCEVQQSQMDWSSCAILNHTEQSIGWRVNKFVDTMGLRNLWLHETAVDSYVGQHLVYIGA